MLTEAELDAALTPSGAWYYMLCPGRLALVDIEPVSQAYLDTLAAGADTN